MNSSDYLSDNSYESRMRPMRERLCRRRDFWLSIKCQVYTITIRSIQLSSSWRLRTEDVRISAVFEHRSLGIIVKYDAWIVSAMLNLVLAPGIQSLEQVLNLDVLRMTAGRFIRYGLFPGAGDGWNMGQDCHSTTWLKDIKSLTSGLSRVSRTRLPSWGWRGPPIC